MLASKSCNRADSTAKPGGCDSYVWTLTDEFKETRRPFSRATKENRVTGHQSDTASPETNQGLKIPARRSERDVRLPPKSPAPAERDAVTLARRLCGLLPYQSWSLEKQPVPGDTGLSRDAPLLLGGTGGARAPPWLFPGSAEASHAAQDAPSTLHATPFSLARSEGSCGSSWRPFWALDEDDEEDDEDKEDVDAPDLERAAGFGLAGLGLACGPPSPASWISSSCLSSSFTTSRM
ncbi:hypothetical protein EYF80_030660 [Liparis tanakae]|uniref:Uncharacterized protein n=1 Tax=Liparis tanakae TaxID=230148 RepID=A0A4Z2H042_9TELE|nr:hypothetical protein EYF80_030660 [Liparis tanakae]